LEKLNSKIRLVKLEKGAGKRGWKKGLEKGGIKRKIEIKSSFLFVNNLTQKLIQ
jgi:hypothetical protein